MEFYVDILVTGEQGNVEETLLLLKKIFQAKDFGEVK